MIAPLERYGGPLCLALLVHMLALAGVIYQWSADDSASRELADEPMIHAQLVAMKPSSPRHKPAALPKERALQKLPSLPDATPIAEVQTPLPPLPSVKGPNVKGLKARDKKDAVDLRQREQQALDDALRAETASLAADSSAQSVQSYSDRFAQMVTQVWSRPPSARNGMQTVLQIELVPTGEVVRVQVKRSSGDEAFDRAAVDAVRQVGRFDVPTEVDIFERHFRRFLFKFNPGDLLR